MGIPLILAINDSYDLSDINIFCIVFTLINPHGDGGTGTTTLLPILLILPIILPLLLLLLLLLIIITAAKF